MLSRRNTVLVVIDVQGKLAGLMHDKSTLFSNIQKLIRGCRVLGVPVLWVEQNPRGLGPTVPEVAGLLKDQAPIEKTSFSCAECSHFMHEFQNSDRKQVVLAGIETHVCVYQTAVDLKQMGCEVEVAADAVSSRTAENRRIGLEKMKQAGCGVTGTETVLFELLKKAEGPEFKEILKIVKI